VTSYRNYIMVRGSGFIAGVSRCRFNKTYFSTPVVISSKELKCFIPPLRLQGMHELTITNNYIDYSLSSVHFEFVPDIKLTEVYPYSGPSSLETIVTIQGTNFRNSKLLQCSLDNVYIIKALFVSSKQIVCKLPVSASPRKAYIRVSYNEQDFSAPLEFEYTTPLTISAITPNFGRNLGGTKVIVTGTNFYYTPYLQCNFGGRVVFAYYMSPTQMACIVPKIDPFAGDTEGDVEVEISDNQYNYRGDGIIFSYMFVPTVESFEPHAVSSEGGYNITVIGTGFTPQSRCRFGMQLDHGMKFINSTVIVCTIPPSDKEEEVFLEVTSNGVD
jgi:hypothetical protein